eukprot:1142668-Pelagomonas_calceolata.AAC.1
MMVPGCHDCIDKDAAAAAHADEEDADADGDVTHLLLGHNIGFAVLDEFAKSKDIELRKLEKSAVFGKGSLGGRQVCLISVEHARAELWKLLCNQKEQLAALPAKCALLVPLEAYFVALDVMSVLLKSKTQDHMCGQLPACKRREWKGRERKGMEGKDYTAVLLAKPVTFMNNSGEAVSQLARFYKVGVSSKQPFYTAFFKAKGPALPILHSGLQSAPKWDFSHLPSETSEGSVASDAEIFGKVSPSLPESVIHASRDTKPTTKKEHAMMYMRAWMHHGSSIAAFIAVCIQHDDCYPCKLPCIRCAIPESTGLGVELRKACQAAYLHLLCTAHHLQSINCKTDCNWIHQNSMDLRGARVIYKSDWILSARLPPGPGLRNCASMRMLSEAVPSGAVPWAWGGLGLDTSASPWLPNIKLYPITLLAAPPALQT